MKRTYKVSLGERYNHESRLVRIGEVLTAALTARQAVDEAIDRAVEHGFERKDVEILGMSLIEGGL